MTSGSNQTHHKFSVSQKNLQKLSEDFNVNLDELDDKTRDSLLALYDPRKYTLLHKILDYAGWFLLLMALIALIRFHWFILVSSLLLSLIFHFVGFLIQRKNAIKHLNNYYQKKLENNQVDAEELIKNGVWENVIEELRKKRPLLANIIIVGKIKPRKLSGNALFLTGDEESFKYLRNTHEIAALTKIVKDITGEDYKIFYL